MVTKSAKRVTGFLGTSALTRPLFMLGAASALLGAGPAQALDGNTLPQNPNVVGGKDTFQQSGNTLNVNQSTNRTVIDWRSFDIGSKAQVNFNQPGTSAIAVNRVNSSANPTQIEGGLHANGQVWILNPNGVFFGKGARVDAAGIVASTANIDTKAFMGGSNKLQMTGADHGAVENQGNITVGANGLAAFVAPSVRNSGTINATVGRVALAAGTTYTLDLAGDHLVELGLGSVKAVVDNSGKIVNPGGTIALTAKAAGQVVNSVVNVSGVVSASSVSKSGGFIVLGADTINTTKTASITADAGTNGTGGTITSIANKQGNYAGSFSAKGGSTSGDGGKIETSGKNVNVAGGTKVNTLAAHGKTGNWTIDPDNLTVVAGSGTTSSTIGADTVEANLGTTGATLSANVSISVNAAIDTSGQTNSNTLNFEDGNHDGHLTVNLSAPITLGANQHIIGDADIVNLVAGSLIQNGVDVARSSGGATVNVGAGTYSAGSGIQINKSGIKLLGASGAEIDVDPGATAQINAITIGGATNNVTVSGFSIRGEITGSYVNYAFGSAVSRGIVVQSGATNFTISNNDIRNVRTGILVDGAASSSNSTPTNSGVITSNLIDNTKSALSINYSDGTGIAITGNKQALLGNEWGEIWYLQGAHTGTASNSVQTALLAASSANNGWTVEDLAYAQSNRTAVTVSDHEVSTLPAAAGLTPSDSNQGTPRSPLATIQAGVNAVVAGGTVNVLGGNYTLATELDIAKSLSLIGAGVGVTNITSHSTGYGIFVDADNTTLSGFTYTGPASGSYGFKVQANPSSAPSGRLHNFKIQHVAINGGKKTGLDLNSVDGAIIDDVSVSNITNGNGIALTDSANVTITHVTTSNNAWGGLALYQHNADFNGQVHDISVDGTNHFNDTIPVYAEDESASQVFGNNIDIAGFSYVVQSPNDPNDVYSWFLPDQLSAINFATNASLSNNNLHLASATVQGYGGSGVNGNNTFYVGIGSNAVAMSINAAIGGASSGATVDVLAGTYNESVNINKANLTLESVTPQGAIIDAGGAANAISVSSTSGNLGTITIDGFTVQNWSSNGIVQGMAAGPFASMRVTNNLVYGPVGGAVANGNGIEVSGNGSIVSGNTVINDHLNSVDWSGSGILAVNGSNIVVENNIIDGADVGIGVTNWSNTAGMSNTTVSGNTVSNADEGISIQAFEGAINGVATGPILGTAITGNTVTDSTSGLGIWDYSDSAPSGVKIGNFGTTVANVSGNTLSNNIYQISTDFTGADLTSLLGTNILDASAINQSVKNTIYGDLQTAVDEAAAGDELDVAGTFVVDSQLEFNQDISIVGNANARATITAGADFAGGGEAGAWMLVDPNVNFALSNVVIDGTGHAINQALRSEGNSTIDNVDFRNIGSPGYEGVAIESFGGTVAGGVGSDTNGAGGSDSHLIVTNSTFENIGREGILVKGDGSTADITGNTYTGKGAGDWLDYGIEVGAGGQATITGNTITGAEGVASDGSTSAGIMVTTYYGAGSSAIIQNNVVTGNTAAVDVGYDGNDTSNVTAFNNNFTGNGVELESANATTDFTGNYWGTTDDATILASMTGAEADLVDFSTYLTKSTDTSTAAGFQGDFSNLTVTTLGAGTDRIAGAEALATAGGTINVNSGTYAEDVVAGKQLAFNFDDVTLNSFTVGSSGAGSSLSGDLTTTGAIALNGNTTVNGDLTAASFTANATLAMVGDLDVSGAAALNGASTITGDVSANTFTANGTLALVGDLSTSGAAALNGAASITGDVTADSLATGNTFTLAGDLVAANGVTLGGASSITGDVTADSLATGNTFTLVGDLVAANGVTLGGASTITGDVSAKTFTANGTLALNGDLAATGAALFNGASSVNGNLNAASITANDAFALNGNAVASGAIALNGATKLAGNLTGGSIALGATTLTGNTTLNTSAANGAIKVASVNGSTAGGQSLAIKAGTGSVSLGNVGATTRLGAVSDASKTTLTGSTYNANSFLFGGAVTLTAATTTLNTTQSSTAAGDITFQGDLFGTTDGGQSLTLIAGPGTGAASANGDITLQNAGTTTVNLNNMTVSGDNFTALTVDLAGNYNSVLTGNQVFAADTLNVKGNATSTVGGDASGHVVAGGDVSFAAQGDVSGTISGQNVKLTGDDVNANVNATDTATITGSTVEGSYTADTVSLTASNNVDAAVNATNFTLAAQNGSVDGTWTTINTDGSGVVNVNGQPTVGLANINPSQLVVEGFVLPNGTIIGANGELILPQGVLLGLLSPGGGKPKMILVHTVHQLGELLASGYSVIVIDLSNRDSGKPIQLASN